MKNNRISIISTSVIAVTLASLALNAPAREVPNPLPRPDAKAPNTTKPIKVFILAGQSNMLEMGTIQANDPGTTEDFFPNAEPTEGEQKKCVNVAVYKGAWSPDDDYDKATPEVTGLVEMGEPRMQRMGRRKKEIPMVPFPALSQQDGHTTVVRGYVSVLRTGGYNFRPGLEEGRLGVFNMTTVEGKEVYRRNPGQDTAKTSIIDLEADKRYAFKTIYFEKPYPEFTIPMVRMPGTLEFMAASDPRYAYLNGDKMSGDTRVVHDAQMAVGDANKHPGFAGSVKTVDTRPFWRNVEQSPGDEGHHYNRNAETNTLVGDALARGMLELLEGRN